MDTKISIVMAYWNRKKELKFTLETILKSKYLNKEIIIVDDCSNEENRLEDFIKNFDLDIKLIRIENSEKGKIVNPCFAFNKGFKAVTGDIVIIQNPECIHVGDVCQLVSENINENNYLSFSCMSSPGFDINDKLYEIFQQNDNNDKNDNYDNVILEYCQKNFFDNKKQWYNHPTIKATDYHFLTAISKNNLTKLGGFDERYNFCHSYDDDDFIARIRYILKLDIKKFDPNTNPFAIHLMHPRNLAFNTGASNHGLYCQRMKELNIPLIRWYIP